MTEKSKTRPDPDQTWDTTTRRSIRVPDNVWKPALRKARANGESLAEVVRRALVNYIDDEG